jgi:hypothetical protein
MCRLTAVSAVCGTSCSAVLPEPVVEISKLIASLAVEFQATVTSVPIPKRSWQRESVCSEIVQVKLDTLMEEMQRHVHHPGASLPIDRVSLTRFPYLSLNPSRGHRPLFRSVYALAFALSHSFASPFACSLDFVHYCAVTLSLCPCVVPHHPFVRSHVANR